MFLSILRWPGLPCGPSCPRPTSPLGRAVRPTRGYNHNVPPAPGPARLLQPDGQFPGLPITHGSAHSLAILSPSFIPLPVAALRAFALAFPSVGELSRGPPQACTVQTESPWMVPGVTRGSTETATLPSKSLGQCWLKEQGHRVERGTGYSGPRIPRTPLSPVNSRNGLWVARARRVGKVNIMLTGGSKFVRILNYVAG